MNPTDTPATAGRNPPRQPGQSPFEPTPGMEPEPAPAPEPLPEPTFPNEE